MHKRFALELASNKGVAVKIVTILQAFTQDDEEKFYVKQERR